MHPYLKCRSCGKLMPLPSSTPEGKPISPTWWPSDKWKRIFLCLQDRSVYLYTAQDVLWYSEPKEGQVREPKSPVRRLPAATQHLVASVDVPCATAGCTSRLRIHIGLAKNDWPLNVNISAEISLANYHDVVCSHGHEPRFRRTLHLGAILETEWWCV